MGSLIAMSLAMGLPQLMPILRADELPFHLPPAVAEDRRKLADAVKAASRCGEMGRPSVADFDAVVNFGWSRKPAEVYILPLELEDALRKHDAANPDAILGDPSLDFHAVDKNLILCVGDVHNLIQESLCDYLAEEIKQKLVPTLVDRIVVEHMKALPAKARGEFIAKLVLAQSCLRSAAKESMLGLVSDEADCSKIIKRVGQLGEEPAEILARLAKAKAEFKIAFAKCLKEAAERARKK